MAEHEPRLDIDAAAPDEMKIANLAELVRAWTLPMSAPFADVPGLLAAECFRHGRQSGFRAALCELREKLANSSTADTDALVDDFLTDYGMGLHIERGRWRR